MIKHYHSSPKGSRIPTPLPRYQIFLPHYVTIAKLIRGADAAWFSTTFLLSSYTAIQVVCCGLEYIFTILKFLQDSMIGVKLNRLTLFNTKFQLRYLLYTLYTFMIGGKYCNTPSVFSVLSI